MPNRLSSIHHLYHYSIVLMSAVIAGIMIMLDRGLHLLTAAFFLLLASLLLRKRAWALALFPFFYLFTNLPIPFVGSPEKFLTLLLLFITILSLIFEKKSDNITINNKLIHLFVIFIIINVVSTLINDNSFKDSVVALISMGLKPMLSFVVYYTIRSRQDIEMSVKSMITLLCVLIVVSLALVIVYSNIYVLRVELLDNHGAVKKIWSAHSLFGYLDFTVIKNPNVLSRVALMILPFVYLYYIDSPKKSVRIFMFMLFMSTMLLIFFTVSRSGIVVLVLSLFYLSYKFRSSLAYKISFSVLILAVVLLISDTVLSERFSKIASGNIQAESRYKLMVASLQSFQEHPLFGSGPGSLGYQLFKFTYLSGSRENFVMGHNLYLNILVETGLMGLLVFLTISFYLLKDIGAVESITLINKDMLILKALNVSLFSFFALSLFAPTLNENFIWFLLGLVYAIQKVSRSQASDTVLNPAK